MRRSSEGNANGSARPHAAPRHPSRREVLDQIDELGQIEWLRQNRRDTHLQHRLRIDAQMCENDDDRHFAEVTGLLQALQKIPAVYLRHGQVEKDDVRLMNRERALSFRAVASEKHLKTML